MPIQLDRIEYQLEKCGAHLRKMCTRFRRSAVLCGKSRANRGRTNDQECAQHGQGETFVFITRIGCLGHLIRESII